MTDLPDWLRQPAPRLRPPRRTPELPRLYAPAWESTPEARRPLPSAQQALNDPRTVDYYRPPTAAQQQAQDELYRFTRMHEMNRNEVNTPPGTYFGQDTLEMTGAPALSRGMDALAAGDPGRALPEVAMGGASILGWGFGAHPSGPAPRVPRIPRTLPSEATGMDMAELGRLASRGFDETDAGFFARMASDEMPTPEEALGRPLTPDHIWNDPRFWHRQSITSDLEGIRTPEERFHIAEQRIAEQQQRNGANDLDAWRGDRAEQLPTLLNREREIGPGHDIESLITMSRNMRNGEFPRALEADLGEYGVGGSQQNTPLLGTPDIGADPLATPRPAGFGARPMPRLQGPNEDRYLFGRPQLPRTSALDAGPLNAEGFDTGRVVYRGLGRQYDPANGGYYQSFTSSLDDAREYGSNVVAAHIRPGRNLAVDGGGRNFNVLGVEQLPADVRARLRPGVGETATTDQIAHAAREAGYDSVTVRNVHDNRWGERPISGAEPRTIDFVFDTRNISPLDSVPEQAARATAAPERTRLSASDRALLDELERDLNAPDGGGAGGGTWRDETHLLVNEPNHRFYEGVIDPEHRVRLRVRREGSNAAYAVDWEILGPRVEGGTNYRLGRNALEFVQNTLAREMQINGAAVYKFSPTSASRARSYQAMAERLGAAQLRLPFADETFGAANPLARHPEPVGRFVPVGIEAQRRAADIAFRAPNAPNESPPRPKPIFPGGRR